MNREKIIAALSAVEITDGALIYLPTSRAGDKTAYCGIGALLHGAGVPDAALKDLDSETAMSLDMIGVITERYGALLSTTYGIPPTELDAALGRCMAAVDDDGAREAEGVVFRMQISMPGVLSDTE